MFQLARPFHGLTMRQLFSIEFCSEPVSLCDGLAVDTRSFGLLILDLLHERIALSLVNGGILRGIRFSSNEMGVKLAPVFEHFDHVERAQFVLFCDDVIDMG